MWTVDETIKFIDATKNFVIAMLFIVAALYMTFRNGTADLATRWVDMAMTIGSIYFGGRVVTSAIAKTQAGA